MRLMQNNPIKRITEKERERREEREWGEEVERPKYQLEF